MKMETLKQLEIDEQDLMERTVMSYHQPMSSTTPKLETKELKASYGNLQVLKGISLQFSENSVTAIMGPSGCGKTTFIRCLNRIHELTPGATVEGQVIFDGVDIYSPDVDPVAVRRKIGMVFQKPNPFPTMSIYDNVAAGLKLTGMKKGKNLDEIVKRSLEQANLWDEVKNDLKKPGTSISGGQQQRLCIARAIALQPEVILMDEPCSALDPIATAKIESLIRKLSEDYTVIIVTHNMQQAGRVSDFTAFLYLGELIEYGSTEKIFENPKNELTEKYMTGKFG
jgi:phosphate transport system ATP-binding protein